MSTISVRIGLVEFVGTVFEAEEDLVVMTLSVSLAVGYHPDE